MEEEYKLTLAYFAVDGKAPEPTEFFGTFASFLSALETARIEVKAMAVRLRVRVSCPYYVYALFLGLVPGRNGLSQLLDTEASPPQFTLLPFNAIPFHFPGARGGGGREGSS